MAKPPASATDRPADTTPVRGTRLPVLVVAQPPRKLTRADFVLVN